jgi:Acyl-CoA dehydrogenase, N-terminal domain
MPFFGFATTFALSIAHLFGSRRIHHHLSQAQRHVTAYFESMIGSISRRAVSRVAARLYTSHSALPEEHKMVYNMCRKLADEVLAPSAGEWDKKHVFPKEAVAQLVSSFGQETMRCCCCCLGVAVYNIPVPDQ